MTTATAIQTSPVTFDGFQLVGYTEHPRMSAETIAFDADLHQDGTKVGVLSNDGTGGDHTFTPAAEGHRLAVARANQAFEGITGEEHGFTYDLVDSLAHIGDIAKTLMGSKYISLVPNMSPEEVVAAGEELTVFQAPRKTADPHTLAEGLFDQASEVSTVVYPVRERGGVWLYLMER